MAVVTAYVDQVQKAYIAYYGRPADTTGLDYWTNQLSTVGGQWTSLINAFGNSTEATTLMAGLTTEQKVNKLYQQMFGRDADASGLTYYSVGIANGTFTLASVAINVLNGASGSDVTTVTNKLTSAKLFTNDLTTAAAITNYNTTTVADVRTWLATVTTTAATQASADAAVSAVVNNGSINGTTYTLTTGVDTIVGTANNDLIVGTYDNTGGAITGSLNVADSIDGAGGTDILKVTFTGNTNSTIPAATYKNVEVINAKLAGSTAGKTFTISAANFPGATNINSDQSTSTLIVTNLGTGAAIGMIGNATVANGDVNFAYATATNAATINISNGTTAGTLNNTGASPTTVVVNSTGAANTVTEIDCGTGTNVTSLTINATTNLTASLDNDYAATSVLTVSGAATAVTLTGGAAATFKTINAAGLTAGGVSVALSTTATGFTGGAGNDTVTTAAITGTAGGINAAGGTADVLVVNATTDLDTAAEGAYYTNFEVLQTGLTQDVSLVSGITALKLSAGDSKSITKMNATQAADVTVTATKATTTLALTDAIGTADALTLKLKSSTATTNVGFTAMTIAGFETLNVQATTGTSGTDSDISFAASGADKLTAVNLAGSTADIAIVGTNSSLAMTVDGSTATGKLAASGNFVSGSTISGGAAVDTFTTGTGFATYNGNAGNDLFLSATVAALNTGANYNYMNGGDGTDTLTVSAAALTMVDDNFKGLTNIEKLTFSGTGAQAVTTGGWFDANFKTAGVTITAANVANDSTASYTLSTFSGATTLALTTAGNGASGADNVVVKTGSAADTVTVTAASWVGHATDNGSIVIQTGAGADTINLQTGTLLDNASAGGSLSITGGTGADVITVTHVNHATATTSGIIFTTAAGDSTKAAYDSITGFKVTASGAKVGDGLHFGTAAIHATVAATAVSGYTAAELTYAINGTTGLVTFAGTLASTRTVAQVLDILDTVVTTAKTVVWACSTDTYVYNADSVNGDSVIKLAGVAGAALVTTNDATTTNGIYIL